MNQYSLNLTKLKKEIFFNGDSWNCAVSWLFQSSRQIRKNEKVPVLQQLGLLFKNQPLFSLTSPFQSKPLYGSVDQIDCFSAKEPTMII